MPLSVIFACVCSGADVDHEGGNGRTPLHEASEAGYNGITELLVGEGRADPIPRDNDDATPYDLAFNNGYKEVCVCARARVCVCVYLCVCVYMYLCVHV